MTLDVHTFGQVFTPPYIVSDMSFLVQSTQRLVNPRLDSSCGNGAGTIIKAIYQESM